MDYKPVSHEIFKEEALSKPEVRKAYDELKEEFDKIELDLSIKLATKLKP